VRPPLSVSTESLDHGEFRPRDRRTDPDSQFSGRYSWFARAMTIITIITIYSWRVFLVRFVLFFSLARTQIFFFLFFFCSDAAEHCTKKRRGPADVRREKRHVRPARRTFGPNRRFRTAVTYVCATDNVTTTFVTDANETGRSLRTEFSTDFDGRLNRGRRVVTSSLGGRETGKRPFLTRGRRVDRDVFRSLLFKDTSFLPRRRRLSFRESCARSQASAILVIVSALVIVQRSVRRYKF